MPLWPQGNMHRKGHWALWGTLSFFPSLLMIVTGPLHDEAWKPETRTADFRLRCGGPQSQGACVVSPSTSWKQSGKTSQRWRLCCLFKSIYKELSSLRRHQGNLRLSWLPEPGPEAEAASPRPGPAMVIGSGRKAFVSAHSSPA